MKAYLEPAEVRLLEGVADCLRDRLLVRLLFRLGCRISEALGIEAKDIDFAQGAVTIQHLKARTRLFCPYCGVRLAKSHTFCPGCGAKVEGPEARELERRRMRALPLDRETLEMLRDYIDRGGPVAREGRMLLFGLSRSHAWKVVVGLAQKAGLGKLVNPDSGRERNVSPHRLRDAFAVMAVQRDDSTDSVRMLQEWLGHASIATTMRYRKVAGQELKEWYEELWHGEAGSISPALA